MLKRISCIVFLACFLMPAWAQEQEEPKRVIEDHQESHEDAQKALDTQQDAEHKAREEKHRTESVRDDKNQDDPSKKEGEDS